METILKQHFSSSTLLLAMKNRHVLTEYIRKQWFAEPERREEEQEEIELRSEW